MYLLPGLLAEKVISLLPCGRSNPMEIPCKAAPWDTDGNGEEMAAPAAASAKCPGNQGEAVEGVQGKWESFGSLLCCSALC